MSNNKMVIEQIKKDIDESLTYIEIGEVAKYALAKAKEKRENYFNEKYNRVLKLKQDLFEEAKYTRSINLCKLLKTLNNSTEYFSNELIESAEKKKAEFEVLKQELEKEITYLNNNNQKEKANKYLEAITLPKKVKKATLSIDDIKVGSIIEFGNYPYNSKGIIAPIRWRIIDIKENKILLITEEAIDCKKYNESWINVTWETCTLRKWLNNEFYKKAFNDNEKSRINLTDVIAHKNPKWNTNQGNNTKDKVFLLSIKEAENYFKNDKARKCVPTDYAVKQGAYQAKNYKVNDKGTCGYWLRSSGYHSNYAVDVFTVGSLSYGGSFVYFGGVAVRPALWMNLESLNQVA